MVRIISSAEALDQLDAIAAYIRIFDPPAADRITASLVTLAESLAQFPERGRPCPDGTREMLTVRPYKLRYDVDGDTVAILSVRHGARLPDT